MNEKQRQARNAAARKFRLTHPGYAKAAQADWYARNKHKELAKKKAQWASLTKEQRKKIGQRRYEKAKIEGRVTQWHIKRYGLSVDEFSRLKEEANGRCMACEQVKKLVIDHDHDSGRVRGLLCPKCNFGIGQFNDDPLLLQAAANYLRRRRLIP